VLTASLLAGLLASSSASAAKPFVELPAWMTESAEHASVEYVDSLFAAALGSGGRAGWNMEKFFDPRDPFGTGSTRWYFARPAKQGDAPSAAIRLDIADHVPYKVHATIYCSDASCAGLLESLAKLPPPEPGREADAELRINWLSTIQSEACRKGKFDTQPGKYPLEELRREIGGRTELRLVGNTCGEVRGAVVTKSSGNRNLDRAARRQALTWRMPDSAGAGASRFWATWVEFRIGDSPAEDASVVNGDFTAVTSLEP
jgi:TonB family protein